MSSPKIEKKSKYLWLKVLLSIVLLLMVILFSIVSYVYLNQDFILKAQLQKLFQSPTTYKQASIGWGEFPWVNIQVQNLEIQGTPTDSVTRVVFANQIQAKIPIWDIYRKAEYIQIPELKIDSLWLSFYMDSHRAKNFKLFGVYNPNKRSPKEINFETITAQKVSFRYVFAKDGRDYLFDWKPMHASLQIHKHDMNILLDVEGKTVRLQEKKAVFMENTPMKVHLKSNIRKDNKRATFHEFNLDLAEMPFLIGGNMLLGEERDYHISLKAPDIQLDKFTKLLPTYMQKQLQVYQMQGHIALAGGIEGAKKPEWNIAFDCSQASIRNVIKNTSLDSVRLKGSFTNGKKLNKSSYLLQIDTLAGSIAGSSFIAGFQVHDFEKFTLNGFLKTDLQLQDFTKWLNWKQTATGRLRADIEVLGQIQALAAFDMRNMRIRGFFQLDSAGIYLPGNHLENLQTKVLFTGKKAELLPSRLLWNKQEVLLDAKLTTEILGWPSKLSGLAHVHFNSLHLATFGKKEKKSVGISPFFSLPAWLDLRLILSANHIQMGKLVVDEMVSDWELSNQRMTLHDLQLRNAQDTVQLWGYVDTQDSTIHNVEMSIQAHSPNWRHSISAFGILAPDTVQRNSFLGQIHTRIRAQMERPKKQEFPKIRGLFEVINAHIEDKKYQLSLSELSLNIPFTEKNILEPTHAPISIQEVKGFLDNQPFKADIFIESLASQETWASLWMEVCAAQVLSHLPIASISDVEGKISFDAHINGKYSNILALDSVVYTSANGHVLLEEIGFSMQPSGLQYTNISGSLDFNDEWVKTDSITGTFENIDFRLKGKSKELLAYLFLKETQLVGNIELEMDTLFLAPLLGDTTKTKAKTRNYNIRIPRNIEIEGIVKASIIDFDRLTLRNSEVSACIFQQQLFLDELKSNFCDGDIQVNGYVNGQDSMAFLLATRIRLAQVNISKLFFSVNNFNQDLLTDDQIEGRISARAEMSVVLPHTLITDYGSLQGNASLKIENGELNQFLPLQKLKGLIKKEYLEASTFDIRCDSLSILNKHILIRSFQIRSNIANIILSGVHKLDQSYVYYIQIQRLKRHISSKEKRELKQKMKVIRKKEDFQNTLLRFKVIGQGKEYKIMYDWKGTWEMLKQSFRFSKK